MSTPTALIVPEEDEKQLAERMGATVTGAVTCLMMSIGDRLGLYPKLLELGPCTPAQLAEALNLSERWVREWLYQQASARFITTDEAAGTFWFSPAQANLLAKEQESPFFMLGLPTAMPSFFNKRDELAHCFRTGLGLTYDAYGVDCACGTHRELSVWVRHNLVRHIRELPELAAALDKGVQVADVGCGCGEALLVLATAFPNSTFRGYDTSHHALSIAEQRLAKAGLRNVSFHNPDHGPEHSLPTQPTFMLVMVHDALHDMTRPDLCLKAIHTSLLREAPACLIAGDWRSCGSPAGNIQQLPVAAMMYGFSVAVCMSSALSASGGLGLGTLGFHEGVARKMMQDAGFTSVETLEWGSELNAYYLARPAPVKA